MADPRPLIRDLAEVIDQAITLTLRLDDAEFARSPAPLASHGVGAHVRHALDVITCLLDGVAAGRVDYDRRERDPRIEREPRFAARRLGEERERLQGLAGLDPATLLVVRMDAPADAGAAAWSRSSLGRELSFVLSHTIHHYALMALLLRSRGLDPGAEFGVAPSTLRFWKEGELVHR
jgi:hypothetical protein